MKVGVVKEIKSDEYRIALTPAGARELVQRGHEVLVEAGAGGGSSFPDDAYESVGASLGDAASIWEEADVLLKVKEPLPSEYTLIREGLILFTYLHLAASEELTRALVESGAACVAYETVETDNRALPLLAPMSEIAGRIAAQAGAYFLEKPLGGRGLLLGGIAGVAPGRVVIVGGGMVGYNAAVIALGLGANVSILERSVERMRHLEEILSGRVSLLMSSSLQLEESIADCDVVIGAVLIPGALAPKLITRPMVSGMKDGAVLVDVAIDQGGCAETSRPTTHSEPVYWVDGVTHYCVTNMPGAVPITSTKALTNATLPFVEAIADHGLAAAVAHAVGGLDLPNLEALGLGNVEPLEGCPPQAGAPAVAGRLVERSKGKDTTTGHWELMGVVTPQPMPTYPHGFPHDVIDPFMHRTGRGVLGNKAASGTDIIQELGEEHQRTGKWIVYTSADSVFQVAAHEETIPLEELYNACRTAREILTGKHVVGRVIARPFIGEPGNYERTPNRHDFSLEPKRPNYLSLIRDAGREVHGVGKIPDIFAGQDIDHAHPTKSNVDGIQKTEELLRTGDD